MKAEEKAPAETVPEENSKQKRDAVKESGGTKEFDVMAKTKAKAVFEEYSQEKKGTLGGRCDG